jgi:hypothetical protein
MTTFNSCFPIKFSRQFKSDGSGFLVWVEVSSKILLVLRLFRIRHNLHTYIMLGPPSASYPRLSHTKCSSSYKTTSDESFLLWGYQTESITVSFNPVGGYSHGRVRLHDRVPIREL